MKLHKEFGLNPTISTCFWCGGDMGGIALLGAGYKKEAPMHMVTSYEPCSVCEGHRNLGVTIIEVNNFPNQKGQPSISEDFYPTGRYWVVIEEVIHKIVPAENLEQVLKYKVLLLDPEGAEKLGLNEA